MEGPFRKIEEGESRAIIDKLIAEKGGEIESVVVLFYELKKRNEIDDEGFKYSMEKIFETERVTFKEGLGENNEPERLEIFDKEHKSLFYINFKDQNRLKRLQN